MARTFWVDPANTSTIVETTGRRGIDPKDYGGTGDSITPIDLSHPDIWPEGVTNENRPTQHEQYYWRPDPSEIYTFTDSAVDINWLWTQRTLDQLRDEKEEELRSYLGAHLTNYADTILNANWKIVLDPEQRIWFGSVSGNLQDRQARQWEAFLAEPGDLAASKAAATDPAKGGVANYWPRNIPIAALNVNTGKQIVQDITRSQWSDIMTDVGAHDFAATDARQLCQDDINATHASGVWDDLAAINVQDPSYGWPNFYGENGGVEVVGNRTR